MSITKVNPLRIKQGQPNKHLARWARAVTNKMRSVLNMGLLPLSQAMDNNIQVLPSCTAEESKQALCGRVINTTSDFVTESDEPDKVISLMLEDCLYSGGNGVISVMGERSKRQEPSSFMARMAFRKKRVGQGIVFLVNTRKIKSIRNNLKEERVYQSIDLTDIDHILVPDHLFGIAQTVFKAFAPKLVRITAKTSLEYDKTIYSAIPDFEGSITQIIRDNPGESFWIHGMRLPILDDIS